MDQYGNLCTQFYDIDKPHAPEDALLFYLQYAEQSGGPILEPMCGSGRFLIPLAQRGFDIDGFDASDNMLDACRRRCFESGVNPEISRQLLHEMELSRQYGLVFIPAGSFGLLTDAAQITESLRRLYDVVLPGGKLILEIDIAQSDTSSSWPWGGRWVDRPDGARIVISWLGNYDGQSHITHSIHRYELIKDGQLVSTEFESFDLRHYGRDEFAGLLTSVGFIDLAICRAYGSEAPAESDESVVFVSRKAS